MRGDGITYDDKETIKSVNKMTCGRKIKCCPGDGFYAALLHVIT